MAGSTQTPAKGGALLASVALLRDLPERALVRGQVGTIVEELDEATALVEFSDDQGRAGQQEELGPADQQRRAGSGSLWR